MARHDKRILGIVAILALGFLGILASRADEKPGKDQPLRSAKERDALLEKLLRAQERLNEEEKGIRKHLAALHRQNPAVFVHSGQFDFVRNDMEQIAATRNRLLIRRAEIHGQQKMLEAADSGNADPRALQLLLTRAPGNGGPNASDNLKTLEPKSFLKLYRDSLQWEQIEIAEQLKQLDALAQDVRAAPAESADLLQKESKESS